MKKCDFCIISTPSGGCALAVQEYRMRYCKKAIKKMEKYLKRRIKI